MKAWASSGRAGGVDVCHRSAPCAKKKKGEREREKTQCYSLCRSGMRRWGSGYFQAARVSPHAAPRQRGSRCAVMSTPDYSRNTARKKMCAPAARTGGSEEPAASSFSTADRGQNDPARPHPLPVHVTAPPPLSLQTQRGPAAHAFSVLLQVDREAFECLSDVIYRESGCARRLSAGASGAAAALGSPALPVITWIIKGVSAGLHRLYSDSQGCEINNRKASY